MAGFHETLAEAVRTGPLAALIVTVVLLLIVGAIFWSFLRRASKGGVSPLAVDRLEAPHLPEPTDPAELPASPPTDSPDPRP